MKKVEVKYKRDTKSHLIFIKIVKDNTELGLKESKDFCDNCREFPNKPFPLFVKDDIKFKRDIKHKFDDGIEILTKEHQRNIKLIKLDSEASIKEMLTDMELDEETLVKFFNKIIE